MNLFAAWLVPVLLSSLLSVSTTQDDPAAAPPAPAPTVRVATYNVLGSNFPVLGRLVGGPPWQRARRAARAILGEVDGRAFDVVGLQEVQPGQDRAFRRNLPGYAAFPARGESRRPVLWRTDRFTLEASGFVRYPGYADRGLRSSARAPWVRLRDLVTGRSTTVVNVHAVAYNTRRGSDRGGAQKRQRTAQLLRAWAAPRIASGQQVVVVGDFNSAFMPRSRRDVGQVKDEALRGRRQLPYCVLTRGGLLSNSFDAVGSSAGGPGTAGCPTRRTDLEYQVDAVYVSRGIGVSGWSSIDTPLTRKASDHLPTYADLGL